MLMTGPKVVPTKSPTSMGVGVAHLIVVAAFKSYL